MRAITVSRYRTQYPYIESVSGYGLRRSGVCTAKSEEILGVGCYAIMIANTIQLALSTQGAVARNAYPYITDSDGDLNVFHVEHDNDELWLNGNNGHPDNFWGSVSRFVFVRRNYTRFSPDFSGEF